MATGGFTFGQTGTSVGGAGTSLAGFGTPKTTTSSMLSGTGVTGGFTFGGAATAAKTTASTGLGFAAAQTGTTTTAAPTVGFPFGGLGGTTTTTTPASTCLTLGGLGGTTTTTASAGFSHGALGGTSTTAASTGFGILGGFGGTSAPTSGITPGNVSMVTTAASGLGGSFSTVGSIFSSVTNTGTKGLGGVDPKTSATKSGTTTTNGKPSDAKAVKETPMPNLLVQTVEDFKKHIKDEKSVREDIARMSSKSMYKVQEDVVSLKQLLSVVSNGLQRNASAIEKLKWEAAQELKNAEMAHRTKDIPAGLQYENTAPTEYFHHLVDNFEIRMQTYRQQIETMESHLASLHQPSKMSPHELVLLLRKLHETFVSLAAQLHQVHEAAKTQKEHYLSYRKVFHADSKDVFERHKKPVTQAAPIRHTDLGGPNPFTGLSSAAAVAMASALNRSQEPTSAPPAVGLGSSILGGQTALTGGLFGSSTTTGLGLGTPTPSFGFGGIGANNTATVKPMGSRLSYRGAPPAVGLGSSILGGQTALTGGLFGSSTTTGLGLGTPTPSFGFGGLGANNTATVKPMGTMSFGNTTGFGLGATSQTAAIATPLPGATPGFGTPGGAPVENKTFFLAKPPTKRGKR